jgi:predicted aconitase with swiveling domain
MAMSLRARVLIDGWARGEVLRLAEPLGMWGGVDAKSGAIIQPAHADFGTCIAGRILLLPGTIGSCSSGAIMLELIREGRAPRAVVMRQPDAILALGAVVAGELDLPQPPFLCADIEMFNTGDHVEILPGGMIQMIEAARD